MNGFEIQCLPGGGLPTMAPQASHLDYPEDWFFEAMTWGPSDSGERVNPTTALGHSPIWQAINILAGDVGQLPWHKMKWTEKDGKFIQERDEDHPLDWLLSYQPNGFQTPSVWREMMMHWALAWGNGISAVIRSRTGEREFLPLLPDRTGYASDDEYGYLITSRIGEREVALTPDEAFHIRGLTSNGFWGLSAVNTCKNRIGHGMAMLRHGNSTFRNGCRPSGVLEHPAKLGPEARTNLRKEWRDIHGGAANAGEIAILWEGMKYNSLSMSNEDAQWLEGMDLDREFVAGLFNLPPFKLGAMKNSAVRANLEEQNKDYFSTSLSRWLNRFNEEAERKLLSMRERRSKLHAFMWRAESFLQGNTKQLMETLSIGVTGEMMTRNEARERLGLNPVEGGDDLRNPAINPQPASAPKPAEDDESPQRDEQSLALARRLVQDRAQALLTAETSTIEREVKIQKNFVKWIEEFYENYTHFAQKFLELACEISVRAGLPKADWRTAVERRAHYALHALLDSTGIATRDSLSEIVSGRCDKFRDQADHLTAMIFGELPNA